MIDTDSDGRREGALDCGSVELHQCSLEQMELQTETYRLLKFHDEGRYKFTTKYVYTTVMCVE